MLELPAESKLIRRLIAVFHSFFQECNSSTFSSFLPTLEMCTTQVRSVSNLFFLIKIIAPFTTKLKSSTGILNFNPLTLYSEQIIYDLVQIAELYWRHVARSTRGQHRSGQRQLAPGHHCRLFASVVHKYLLIVVRTHLGKTIAVSETRLEANKILATLHPFISSRYPAGI